MRTTSHTRRVVVMVVLGISAAGLAGCGSSSTPNSASASASTAAGKGYNPTDAAFVASMLPHHLGGIELGMIAAEKGVNPRVKSIGQNIVDAQTRESATLRQLLAGFGGGKPVVPAPIEARDMAGMKMLTEASGSAFDSLWLDIISGHHSAAIQMAGIEMLGGESAEARQLASSIVTTQSGELTQFNALSPQIGKRAT